MSNPTFSLWRCCLKGETKPRLKKKPTEGKAQNGGVEIGKEAKPDEPADNNLEYAKPEEPMTPTATDTDRRSNDGSGFESGYENSEVDSSAATSEIDGTPITPSAIQILPKGSVPSTDIGAGGRLHLQFNQQKESNRLSIKIDKIEFAAHQQWRQEDLEVSCMLLPLHKQSFRRRATRFGEVISVQLPAPAKGRARSSSLRFRIYDHKTITKKYLIGQGVVNLDDLKLAEAEVGIVLDLTSPQTYGIDSRYMAEVKPAGPPLTEEDEPRPEILISLEYRKLTRKLIAEVVKTRNLGLWTGVKKPQDLCVQLRLKDRNNQVMRICQTSVKRHCIDVENNEMFMFRLDSTRVHEVSLQFCVMRVSDIRKKEDMVGECCFGISASSNEEAEHWGQMFSENEESKVLYRWHRLYK